MDNNLFENFLLKIGNMPTVHIDREQYLKNTFKRDHREKLAQILKEGPLAAGVSDNELSKIAGQAISAEARTTISLSAIAGAPGGVMGLAAIPADIAQYYGHLFRILQKLMYLYGWTENVFDEDGELDDATKNMVILCMGYMFGVRAASKALAQLAKVAAKRLVKGLSVRVIKGFVTKRAFREVIIQIVKHIGMKTAAKVTILAPTKFIPVVGAAVSGGITALGFIPMAKRMKRYFESGQIKWDESDDELEEAE